MSCNCEKEIASLRGAFRASEEEVKRLRELVTIAIDGREEAYAELDAERDNVVAYLRRVANRYMGEVSEVLLQVARDIHAEKHWEHFDG